MKQSVRLDERAWKRVLAREVADYLGVKTGEEAYCYDACLSG